MKLDKLLQIAGISKEILKESKWTYDLDDIPDNPVNDSGNKKKKIDSFIKQLQQFGVTNEWKNLNPESDPPTEIYYGTLMWKNEQGEYHREGNLPAIIRPDGRKEYWINGKPKRTDGGPTYEHPNGTQTWKNEQGQLHREGNLPAYIYPCGTKEYFINGISYDPNKPRPKRTDGGPTEEWSNGTQIWKNEKGEYHREGNLPAIIYPSGRKEYFINGKPKRTDGGPTKEHPNGTLTWQDEQGRYHREGNLPAIIYSGGRKGYWINGKQKRTDGGPTIEDDDGTLVWKNEKSQWHREGNLPAIIHHDGRKEYWINGKWVDENGNKI